MVRRKINVKARRLAIALLVAVVLMKSNLSSVPMNEVLAEGSVVLEDAEELLQAKSASLANTETKKVDVDPTSIAQTQIYKEMDYSFLKEYPFGQTNAEQATVTFGSVEELKKSKDVRLVAGRIIKTEGYYESGDGGNAVYKIYSEYDMGKADIKEGAILLTNGLYACILPDVHEIDGKQWLLVNAKQFGASGDGITPSQDALSAAFSCASKHAAKSEDIFRGLVYIPAGEYKCANEVQANSLSDVNIVGDGDSTVLFTDNDYREEEGYSEFFFASWSSTNIYFGDFRIEAREVDLYHYMRQFVLIYCDNIYIYNVDLIVPQEAYSGYYYEDKQYSNFCCYSGDTNITVDGCTMVQFSGTYRGANVGILDFWDKEVKNITVMNCDLYSNARDEQIGIFNIPKTGTKVNENTSISNIDLINNSIHTIPVKYTEVVGNQNMCFTVAYGESVRISDVRIAGNHFICEADSKFMTFGTITDCVVENNIIEITSTRNNGASVFDSSNENAENIIIRNNEFFLTSVDGNQGKASIMQGKLTFEGNRVFSDGIMPFYIVGQVAKNNEFIFLKPVKYACGSVDQVEENTFYLYGGTEGEASKAVFNLTVASGVTKASVKNNTVYDYKRSMGTREVFEALVNIGTYDDKEIVEFSGNTYYAPNRKYKKANYYNIDNEKEDVDWTEDENGKKQITAYYNRLFYLRGPDDGQTSLKKVIFENNTLQGVKGYVDYCKPDTVEYVLNNNTTLPYEEDLSEDDLLVSSIDILYNNQKTTEIAVIGDTVNLDKIVRVAARDEDGNILTEQESSSQEIKWYTSVESMATVSEDGKVTRKMYGDVKVYAVSTDGSGIYGECTIHFLKNQAASLSFSKENINLQPGLKYYADYTVLPEEAPQNLKWTSSDENVATVSKTGLITANSVGTAVITGTTTDGSKLSGSITVKVTPVTVKKMIMDNTWLYFDEEQIGESKQLSIGEYIPENATNQTVKRWESTDPSVAVVDNQGKITVVGNGRTEIRAYSTDEYCYAVCKVYVQPCKVTNFKATSILKDKVILSWEPVDKCYGYYIYQWDDANSTWTQLNNGKALERDVTSFTVSNLTSDTEYKFCIRSYYWNSLAEGNHLHESKDSILTVKTYGYNPVTYIKGKTDVFTVIDNGGVKQGTFTVTYNSDANYNNLDFTYEIKDESIAKITSIEDGSNAGEKNIVIEGLKYGTTILTVTSNDDCHASVQIPVGVVPGESVNNCTAEAIYKQVTIQFDGLADESDIDGYYVQLVVAYNTYSDVGYIQKTGATTYSIVDKNVEVGTGTRPGGYVYTVSPCRTDGSRYYLGNRVLSNKNQGVSVPEPTAATSLKMGQEQYIVKGGEEIEVSAKVGNEDASTNELYWEIINENYATVGRVEKTNGETLTDYATITGIDAGVTKIKAVTTDGSEIETSAKLIVTPQPVENLTVKSELTDVSLSWKSIKNADGYAVYRWDEKKQEFKLISEVEECCFQDSNLEPNTSYCYKVIAYMYVDGVKYEGKSTSEISVATASNNYGIYATGYSGYYDGKSHSAVTLQGVKNKDTVTYSTDLKNWTTTVPTVTEVKDSGNIYIKVEREGQAQPYQITVEATVLACPIQKADVKLEMEMVEWNGKAHTPKVISETCVSGKDYTASGIKSYKNIGTYQVTITGTGNYTGTKELTYKIYVAKGHKYKVSGYSYKVTGKNTVSVVGVSNKKKTTITVKNTVKIGGKTYKITSIGTNAFKNCKKVKKVTIGKYVTTIGKNAFYGDKKLKKIIIKSKQLKKVGKNALKGVNKTVQIQVPKSKRSKYKKLFKKSTGYVSTMKLR